MTIENLGVKLYSGTKSDRKSDSLGSSADGANTGIVNQNFSSNGIYLDGGNVDFTATGLFDGTGDFSIAFWVKPTDVSSNRSLFFTNGTGSGIFQVFYTTSSGGTWRINLDGSDDVDFALTLNSWNHVVITKTSVGVWTVYVNKTAGTPVTNNVTLTSGTTYRLGQSYDASYPEYYKGYIQQFLIYDDVLTQTEVNTLYDLGRTSTSPSTSGLVSQYNLTSNANDSQGSNNGTASGIKLGTGAYSLDGNDYVEVNGLKTIFNGATKLSIAGWIYPRDNVDETLLGQWNGSGNSDKVMDLHINGSNKLELSLRDGSTNYITTSSTSINENEWQHVAMTYDGATTTVKLYINGTLDVEDTSNPSSLHTGTGSPALFGIYGDKSSNGFDGNLDDWGCWSRVITATEIETLYSGGSETTPTITDPLTSDLGWVANGTGNGYNASDYIDFKMVSPDASSGSNRDTVYIDLQDADYLDGSNLATNFAVRCKVNFTDLTIANVNENKAYLGFYDTTDWGGTAQDAFALEVWTDNGSSSRRFYNIAFDGATFESGSETKSQFALVPTTGTYYVTFTKSGDSLSIRLTTNSDYSGGEVETITKSGLSNLRYFGWKGRGDTQNNIGNTQGKIEPSIKIWNDTTSTNNGQLVSSLTNKSELKAYYSMDTESVGLRINQDQSSAGTTDTMNSSGKIRAGLVITSASFSAVGETVSKLGFYLKKTGDPSGNVTAVVANSSGSVLETVGTKDISSDITTSFQWIYFENTSASHVLANGERIELRYSGGDGSNTLNYQWYDGDVIDYCNYATYTSSYDNMTSRDPQIKIYTNGSGCPNDFSSTSDLEALSGVRTNSIFQQTDSTPSYWWYNGTSWVLDGTTEKQFDFSSDTGWTQSSGNVTIDTSNTELDFHIESGTGGAKGYYDLGLANVSDTKWVLRFEKVNFSTLNTYGEMWLGLSSITSANGANSGSMIAARPADYGDSDDYLSVQSFNSSTTEVTGNEVRPDYSTGVNYDIEIKRTSATTVEAKLYTDNFGTLVGTSSDTISGTTGLRYLFVGSRYNTGAGNTNTNAIGTIQSIKFQNGTSEWLE